MTRYHNVNGEKVPFTAQEETDRDAEEAQVALDEPMELWKQEMRESDGGMMPRFLEDLITNNASLVIPAEMKKRYDEKLKIRGERP